MNPLAIVAALWFGCIVFTLAMCKAASKGNNVEGGPVALDVSNIGKSASVDA